MEIPKMQQVTMLCNINFDSNINLNIAESKSPSKAEINYLQQHMQATYTTVVILAIV